MRQGKLGDISTPGVCCSFPRPISSPAGQSLARCSSFPENLVRFNKDVIYEHLPLLPQSILRVLQELSRCPSMICHTRLKKIRTGHLETTPVVCSTHCPAQADDTPIPPHSLAPPALALHAALFFSSSGSSCPLPPHVQVQCQVQVQIQALHSASAPAPVAYSHPHLAQHHWPPRPFAYDAAP